MQQYILRFVPVYVELKSKFASEIFVSPNRPKIKLTIDKDNGH